MLEERAAEQRGDSDHSPNVSSQAADAGADLSPAERSTRSLLKSQSLRPRLTGAARVGGTDPVGALQVALAHASSTSAQTLP